MRFMVQDNGRTLVGEEIEECLGEHYSKIDGTYALDSGDVIVTDDGRLKITADGVALRQQVKREVEETLDWKLIEELK